MITRGMIIDAIGKLTADMADGTWGLPEDRGGPMWAHPAVVELFDHLPDATRPPESFRPVGHYAPGGAKMIDAIERLESKLAAIELVLDAHRAALMAAGWMTADGKVVWYAD